MKRFLKKSLAMFLCLSMVMGMALVGGVISAPVASAAVEVGSTRTIKTATATNDELIQTKVEGIPSYADLVAAYGTNVGADSLTDGFLYIGAEYYEADGNLTDYYVQPGDKLTAKVYVKSNMYTADATIISLFNNSHWDVTMAGIGMTEDDLYTNGYTSGWTTAGNTAHPAWITNGYKNAVTSINITNAGWIKNTCGFDTTYLAATDLVQVQSMVDSAVSSAPYKDTSDIWKLTYQVKVKEGLADGTEIKIESPDVLWASYVFKNKHDTRKRAYIANSHITATGMTSVGNCKTMAAQMDSGSLDYFILDLDKTFVIGEPPVPGAATTATFMVDGEVYGDVVEYEEGDTIEVPADPEKEGYTFTGWDSTPGVMGTESLVFNATWKANEYTVTWDVDGETTTETVAFDSAINAPADPEKEGYTFAGWTPEVPATMPAEDKTFTATWTVNNYTVTWDVDGKATTESVAYGAAVNAPADPEKEGHTFAGWEGYEEGMVMPAEDLTLTATWNVNDYTVTWDVDGETTTETVVYGAVVNAPADPEKEGHTFAGWTPSIPSSMPAKDMTFTATWDVNNYTVTWDVDGEATEVEVAYGAEISLPAEPAKEGHTFTGWEGYEEGMIMPAEDLTFVATWEVNTYKATFDVDGVTTEVETVYGEAIDVPADPEMEGYTFTGWTPAIPDAMPAEDLTFTATWKVNEYTVTWDVDGETNEETYEYGDPIAIPTPPEKDGYIFVGWDPEIPDNMPAKDITLTAKWEKIIVTSIITLDANGGKFSNGAPVYPVKAEVGVPFNAVPDDPTRDGFTFVGWVDEDGNATSIPRYFPEEDVTIKAVWAEGEGVVYTVETYTMDTEGNYGAAEVAYYTTEEATVTAETKTEEGFSVDADKSVLEAEVAADGSTVLEVYYARNKYTVTFDADGGSFDGEATVTAEVYYGAAIVAPEAPVMDEYYFDGWDAEIPATMPAEDLTFTATWAISHIHETEEVIEKATCTEDGRKYNKCIGCGEIVGEVEVIKAKGHVAGEWVVEVEATLEAEGIVVKRCTVCDEIVETSTIAKLPAPALEITDEDGVALSATEITYGETVALTVGNLPEGATVEWYVEGEGVEVTVSEDGTCYVTSVESGKATITAVVTDENGEERTAEIKIESDACLFQRIIRFFKNLFANCFLAQLFCF